MDPEQLELPFPDIDNAINRMFFAPLAFGAAFFLFFAGVFASMTETKKP